MKNTGQKRQSGMFFGLIKQLIICYIITGIILLVLAFIVYKMSPPEQFVSGGIIFSYVMSSFIGGIMAGKKAGSRKYIWGIIFGMLFFALILLVSYIIEGYTGRFPENALTVFLLCVSGGMLGGMFA